MSTSTEGLFRVSTLYNRPFYTMFSLIESRTFVKCHLYTITLPFIHHDCIHHLRYHFQGKYPNILPYCLVNYQFPQTKSPNSLFLYKETLNSTGSWDCPKTRFTHHLEVFPEVADPHSHLCGHAFAPGKALASNRLGGCGECLKH